MKKKINFLQLARKAAAVAEDKKGTDIVIYNVHRLTALTDYFLIVTVQSAPQMNAIVDGIFRSFKTDEGLSPVHREGVSSPSWGVLDYGGLVIHVMTEHSRALYALDRVWGEARKV